MTCAISKSTIANGIQDFARQKMIESKLFDYEDEIFYVKDEGSKHQQVVDAINLSFDEEIISKMGSQSAYAIVTPSDKLLNEYMEVASSPSVNYDLRSIQILSSPTAEQKFKAGEKGGWSLNRILTELQIPEYQRQILLGENLNTREEMLGFLVADMTFAVDIDVAKTSKKIHKDSDISKSFKYNNIRYFVANFDGEDLYMKEPVDKSDTPKQIEKDEYDKAFEEAKFQPSSHYESMVVPGGVNYRENRIFTPKIVPAITGHAAFAQSNDIGWFRSDDRQLNREEKTVPDSWTIVNAPNEVIKEGTPTRTRRILEFQSDLFQKSRNRVRLNKPFANSEKVESSNGKSYIIDRVSQDMGDEYGHFTYKVYNANEYQYGTEKGLVKKDDVPKDIKDRLVLEASDNNFLRILNTDNAWVSFFIRSIIQDSAKKGYKEVRFPAGNTALKVEGYTTLEAYITKKEERLNELNTNKLEIETTDSSPLVGDFEYNYKVNRAIFKVTKHGSNGFALTAYTGDSQDEISLYDTEEAAEAAKKKEEDKQDKLDIQRFGVSMRGDVSYADLKKGALRQIERETTQLEEEIKDARAGKDTMSSIHRFYEQDVFNVLRKRGYNPTRVTDENGNDWYRVGLNITHLDKIFLSAGRGKTLSDKQQAEFENLQRIGLISDQSSVYNGKEIYKVLGDEDGEKNLREIIREKGLDFINVNTSGNGAYVELGIAEKAYPQDITQLPNTTSTKATGITKQRVLRFLENIGFTNIQVLHELEHNGVRLNADAYIDFINGVMKIREGMEDYTLPEEAMHILVELIKQAKPELYMRMRDDIINYKIYREVYNDPAYSESPYYQNLDGTLDTDKIRDEAIAKLLAEYLISQMQGATESTEKIATVYSWWKALLQWIKEKFGLYKNPFTEALDKINEDDTTFGEFTDITGDDIFFSATSIEDIDKANPDTRSAWENIKNRAETQKVTKVGVEYYKDGQLVPKERRVTYLKDKYYERLFGKRNFDDILKEFYDLSAQDGSYIHEIFEAVLEANVDPLTGLMRRTPNQLNYPLTGNPIQGKIAKKLENYMRTFMARYPQGTRFLSEQVIYDAKEDRYGTIDFLAVVPEDKAKNKPMTVDIIDWKSMLMKDIEGVKDYKKGGIFIQINEYARILRESYGVQNIGRIRAIPISKVYRKENNQNVLDDVHMGNTDPAKIPSDEKYLRPIISPEESAGSEAKDFLTKKLENLYQKYINKGYFKTDRTILSDITDAIYEIRVGSAINSLNKYFIDLNVKFDEFLKEVDNIIKRNNQDEINEALSLINFYNDTIKNVVEPTINLAKDTSIDEKSKQAVLASSGLLLATRTQLNTAEKQLLNTLAEGNRIFGLLKPEKIINFFQRWFRSIGSQDIASVRLAYELVKKAFNRISLDSNNDLERLKDLKVGFDAWKKKTGSSNREAVGMLVNYKTGRLHSKISSDFFKARDKLVEEKKSKDILAFVKANYNMKEWADWYTETLKENTKNWKAATYDQDKKKNDAIIKRNILNFEKTYNILKNPVTAYGKHNPKIWGKNIKEELWYSDTYKELLKPQNTELLEMYNFMLNKNKELAEVGGIKEYEQYTFLPNLRRTVGDIFAFDTNSALRKAGSLAAKPFVDAKNSILVGDYELNYQGARDPDTGELIEKRFIPYVSDIDNEYELKVKAAVALKIIKDNKDVDKLGTRVNDWIAQSGANEKAYTDMILSMRKMSFDIFEIYGLMSKQINKEKYLSEIDDTLRALLHMEKMKPNILRNKSGRVAKTPSGKAEVGEQEGKNAPVLENFLRYIVNGESLQYDADFVVQFKLREKWNNSRLGKLYHFDINPETYKPTAISATKFIMALNNYNQKRVLGLNAASAISNLFGGRYAASRLYKKYIGDSDLNKKVLDALGQMTSGRFYTEGMKKKAALVDYFLPLLNNRESFKASQLSVNQASTILSQEWLMMPMRTTSEIVQLNIFLAVLENTGVVNNKVVNLREMAAQELNYYDRYKLKYSDVKDIEKKFEARVKELKEQYGILKYATYTTVKRNGHDETIVTLPGVDRNGEDVANLRDIIQTMSKDALGEVDEFDLAAYRYSIYGRLMMTFKNWIPRQIDVRYGEFRYDQAHHAYEYGRFRMFWRAFSANLVQTFAKLVPVPYLTGKVTDAIFTKEALIQRAKDVYARKLAETEALGKYDARDFISEGEFVDRFVNGVESTFAEMRTIALMGLIIISGIMVPDDDDDPETKALKKLALKQVGKLSDEVGFFYNPKSGVDILGGAMPLFSIVRDVWKLGSDVSDEFFGFTYENLLGMTEKGQKLKERAKPVKRTFKIFPVLKEILTYLPAIDDEVAKEWGVRVNDRREF